MKTRPQKKDSKATRQLILSAAATLFVERGPAATSIRHIADVSGVNKSLIHHHFVSKEGLWTAVKQYLHADYHAMMEQILSRPADRAGALREAMAAQFEFFRQNPKFVRLHTWLDIERDCTCAELSQRLYALGTARLYEAQARGGIRRDIDPRHLFLVLWSLAIHWFQGRRTFSLMLDGDDRAVDDAHLDQILKIIRDGITPKE